MSRSDRLDYYHHLERERIHPLLIDDARRGLEDVAAGRTEEADAAIAALQKRPRRRGNRPPGQENVAEPPYRVELTASFLERLESIEAFLREADMPLAYDALLAVLRDTVIPNLAFSAHRPALPGPAAAVGRRDRTTRPASL